ncbi:MAG: hypothetical protein JXB05_06260 [Myxococcaceae bacterium]|nr:hypothetical protein [Myxococcaceae bacterium]
MHQCPECGEVAAEPRLRYCEHCGARMPEFKPAALVSAEGAAGPGGAAALPPPKPAYTGPKWLAPVPAHSPTALGVILHLVALALSIIPTLAGVGPFWALVMAVGGVLVIAREYRASNEVQPLVEWIPSTLHPPFVPAAYSALALGLSLHMMQLSIQPVLWLLGTLLVVNDQWLKVFAGPNGYARNFSPRQLVRVPRVVGFAGIMLCLLSLFFTWTIEGEVPRVRAFAPSAQVRPPDVKLPPADVVYGGAGGLPTSGLELPVSSTMVLGLWGLLILLMLRRKVARPVWLRFVPAGFTVISVAWALVNMRLKPGPVMFVAGLIPMGLMAVLQAAGREDLYAEEEEAPVAATRTQEELPVRMSDPEMRDDSNTEPANFSRGGPPG